MVTVSERAYSIVGFKGTIETVMVGARRTVTSVPRFRTLVHAVLSQVNLKATTEEVILNMASMHASWVRMRRKLWRRRMPCVPGPRTQLPEAGACSRPDASQWPVSWRSGENLIEGRIDLAFLADAGLGDHRLQNQRRPHLE